MKTITGRFTSTTSCFTEIKSSNTKELMEANFGPLVFEDLEFQHEKLVKIRGMRPEYLDGHTMIRCVKELALMLCEATRKTDNEH